MGNLSAHFSRHEFACPCGCGFDTVDAELLITLEALRDYLGAAITVNSGARCLQHNTLIGGADDSQHMVCKAADISVRAVSPIKVAYTLEAHYPDTYGIGRYHTFTHLDVRAKKARWEG